MRSFLVEFCIDQAGDLIPEQSQSSRLMLQRLLQAVSFGLLENLFARKLQDFTLGCQ